MRKLKLNYDVAFEEVIADSCESFLVDSNIPIGDGKLRAFVLFDIFKIYNIMYMRVNQVVAGNVRKRLSEESPGSIEQE